MNKENNDFLNSTKDKASLLKMRRDNANMIKQLQRQHEMSLAELKRTHTAEKKEINDRYEEKLKEKQEYIQILEKIAQQDPVKQPELTAKYDGFVWHQTPVIQSLGNTLVANPRDYMMMTTQNPLKNCNSKLNTRRASSRHKIQPVPKMSIPKML